MMVPAEWKEGGVWQETDPDLNPCFSYPGSGIDPGATPGTRDPVMVKPQPMINKMISATDRCYDGNETGG